jgi:hypothetical protein
MDKDLLQLLEHATRPDRLYPIQSNKYYGFHAGRLPDGRQALIAIDETLTAVFATFDRNGNLVEAQYPTLPAVQPDPAFYYRQHEGELVAYVRNLYGLTPALIRIKQFVERDKGLSVRPIPFCYSHLHAQADSADVQDESLMDRFRRWLTGEWFVLDWYNDYWLDGEGAVASS